ncbi:DoxX family protein [Bacillus subtilis]|nr:DoxX family protein [Bacillus subtilis]WGD84206.1 DoxX family protein [Bacillus subtilis]WGD87817.1 DoxX family protein [Bacillus subtilis]
MMNKGGRLRRALRKSIPATFRLFLAFNFFVYGLAKVVIGQFGEVTPEIEAAPGKGFTIAWTFFGYSHVYELFIGFGEILAAVLLLIPRTAALGAVIFMPIIVNIVLINYCFDIGVQDLSTILMVMCLILLWMDRRKFMGIFRQEPIDSRQVMKR